MEYWILFLPLLDSTRMRCGCAQEAAEDSQEWLSHLPRNREHEASCPTRKMLG